MKSLIYLDAGNTFFKCLIISGDKSKSFKISSLAVFKKKLALESISAIFISSVLAESRNKQLKTILKKYCDEVVFVSEYFKKYIKSEYNPHHLGMDRQSTLLYAFFTKCTPCVIIDAGTAITVDFFINNTYKGGIISAGLNLEFKALNTFTKRLPLLKPEKLSSKSLPKKTRDAMLTGVIKVKAKGIESIIKETLAKYTKSKSRKWKILLTGGDAKYLAPFIKGSTTVENMVIQGLIELSKTINYR